MFSLQGPGGTGKTFVENHVLAKIRLSGNVALAVASSGIASLLLKGGENSPYTIQDTPQPGPCDYLADS